MKILRLVGMLGFFQVAGFLTAVVLVLPTVYLIDAFDAPFGITVVPALAAIGIALYASKPYHRWLSD